MNEEQRDLAIKLWVDHKMAPEDLAKYESIKHLTTDDVMEFETSK